MKQKTQRWVWVVGALLVVYVGYVLWQLGSTGANPFISYKTPVSDSLQSPNTPSTFPVATQTRTDNTVLAVISGLPNASRFTSLLSQSGVSSELSGSGPYTVFVPVNEGFSLLPPGALSLNTTQLKRLVEYHVITGKTIDVNIQTAGVVQALSRDMLNFSVRLGDQSARINSSVALQAIKTNNGIVYLVDQVLLPPAGN